MALALVLQDDIALGVLHLQIGPGLVVNAVVGEAGVGRRHLHGVQAVGQTAQAQSCQIHIIRHQAQIQLLRGKGEGLRLAHGLQGLHSDGIDGVLQARLDQGAAPVLVGGVLRPGIAVELPDGIVVKGGARRHRARVNGRRIHGQRLNRGAHLPLTGGCKAPVQIAGLLADLTHRRHHVAGGGFDNGDAGLQLLAATGGHVQITSILIHRLCDSLDVRVQGRINMVTAVVELQPRFLHGNSQLLGQVRGDIPDDLVHKPGIDLHTAHGLGHQFFSGCGCVTVGKLQDLRLGCFGLFFGQEGCDAVLRLAVHSHLGHLVQNELLTVLVQFPGCDGSPVLPGVSDVVHGTVQGRVVGNGDQTGALRHRQVLQFLAEVVLCRRLDAVAALTQIDGVQIQGQYLLFCVILLKLQCPENLPHLSVDGAFLVPGHVLQHLLGDGGAAESSSTGEDVQRRLGCPLPVHTVVLEKPLVLNSHSGLPQGVRNLVILGQNAILLAMYRLEGHPLSCLLILIVDKGAERHGIILRSHFHCGDHTRLHILHENARDHRSRANADQDQRSQDAEYLSGDPALAPVLPALAGRLLRRAFSSSVLQRGAPPLP